MKKEEREKLLKQKLKEMSVYENRLFDEGNEIIAGVDEVGRGPLAGPVVAAAVVLPKGFDVIGIDDSKKLTPKKREELNKIIREDALAWGFGQVEHDVIDRTNILRATKQAMEEAIENCRTCLRERGLGDIDHILLDAVTLENTDIPQTSIIKGDSKSVSIAAASIVAKVERDTLMIEYHKKYPYYSFDSNKGYGTKKHYEGIKEHGICPIHRKTFLKKLI